jgi:hypothetical protein
MNMAQITEGVAIAQEIAYLPIEENSLVVVYVAKDGKTKEDIHDHYKGVMIPWLKAHGVTKATSWIARHDGLLSIIIQVDVYYGDWREIPDIHLLYRSDSQKMLMAAELLSKDSFKKC